MATVAPLPVVARSAKAERAVIDMRRMNGLQVAAVALGGQRAIAAVLGIDARSVRAKLAAERGVFDSELEWVARALEQHAAKLVEHAAKLRSLTGGER